MRRNFSRTFPLFLFMFGLFSCENPYEKAKADAKKFPSISKARIVGSLCSETDSASEKRAAAHPLGPTGGWSGNAYLDTSRTSDTLVNTFRRLSGDTVGFVKFETKGSLRVRSYDDVYGEVYCGWSPKAISYTPEAKAVYLRMDRCSVGDGGLSQITEVCWFPDSKKEGTIVYSTAHPEPATQDDFLFFSKEDIGRLSEWQGKKSYYYQDYQAQRIFHSLMKAGRKRETYELVLDTLQKFEFLGGAIDGSTRKPISPREFHAGEWKSLLLMKAGFELFQPSGGEALKEVNQLIKDSTRCSDCQYAKWLTPFYAWLVSSVQGEKIGLPHPDQHASHVQGYDSAFVYRVLSDPTVSEATLQSSDFTVGGETTYFWIGSREFLRGNYTVAESNLRKYLSNPNGGESDFELSATLTLLEKIEQLKKEP